MTMSKHFRVVHWHIGSTASPNSSCVNTKTETLKKWGQPHEQSAFGI